MLFERGRGVGDLTRGRRTHLVRCRRRLITRLRDRCVCAGFEFVENLLNISQTLFDQVDLAFTANLSRGFSRHERTSGEGALTID